MNKKLIENLRNEYGSLEVALEYYDIVIMEILFDKTLTNQEKLHNIYMKIVERNDWNVNKLEISQI